MRVGLKLVQILFGNPVDTRYRCGFYSERTNETNRTSSSSVEPGSPMRFDGLILVFVSLTKKVQLEFGPTESKSSRFVLSPDFYHEIVSNTTNVVVAGTNFVDTGAVGACCVTLHQVRVVIIG